MVALNFWLRLDLHFGVVEWCLLAWLGVCACGCLVAAGAFASWLVCICVCVDLVFGLLNCWFAYMLRDILGFLRVVWWVGLVVGL